MRRLPGAVDPPDMRAARRRRRRDKVRTLISNEIIVESLAAFLAERYPAGAGAVLDLGAGSKPYAPLYDPYFERSVALDLGDELYGREDADVLASGDAMPFPDESFDCVVCTEMLEHCAEPDAVLREVRRVLRPGGTAFITTPFMKGLHDMPDDYYRYTPSALRFLGERAGLRVETIEPRGDLVGVALSIWLYPVAKALGAMPKPLFRYENPLVWLFLAAPQLAYLRYWRSARRGRSRAAARLALTSLGYVTVMARSR